MLLNNRTIKYILIILLFAHVLFVNVTFADDGKEVSVFKTINGVKQVLNLYTDKSFDAYLEDRLHYNVSDYQSAIYYLFNEYRVEISKTDRCFEVMQEIEKKSNGDWVNDLVAFAGRDYILENINSFQRLLSNINRKNVRSFCRENEKDVIFSEVHYLLNFKEFLNEYLSYVETLPKNQQRLSEKNVKVAKTIIESIANPPMQTIFYGNRVESYLSVLNKVKMKPEVANYILNHPVFSKPFNLMQAIDDLGKIRIAK